MKLTNSVYMVASGKWGYDFTHAVDCNVYLVKTDAGYIMIDSGVGIDQEKMFDVIKSQGIEMTDIKKLLLTHYHGDHACGAAKVKELSGCEVYAPAKEAKAIETGDEIATSLAGAKGSLYPLDFNYPKCPGVIGLNHNDTVTLGNVTLKAFMIPGHSLEDMVIYGEIDGKQAIFTGDCVFAAGQVLIQSLYDVSIYPYAEGMKELAKLEIDSFFPGHGVFTINNGIAHIQAAANKFASGLIPNQLFYFA